MFLFPSGETYLIPHILLSDFGSLHLDVALVIFPLILAYLAPQKTTLSLMEIGPT